MPKFSVLVIAYNQEKIIRQTIDSLLKQKFLDIEFIISDDCSTDGTWQIIDSYRDERLIKIRQPKNLGINGNSNSLFARASGDYVLALGGDDCLLGTNVFNLLEESIAVDPQIDCWIVGRASSLDGQHSMTPNFKHGIWGADLVRNLILGKIPFFLFQQVVFRNMNPPLSYPVQKNAFAYGEDIDLLYGMLRNSICAPLGRTLILYRSGAGVTAEANKSSIGFYLHNSMIRRWVNEKSHYNFSKLQVMYIMAREYMRVRHEMPNSLEKAVFIKKNFQKKEIIFAKLLSFGVNLPSPLRKILKKIV